MASITSNGTGGGLSNVGASWAGGIVPVEGDKVTIAATDTITVTGTHIWGDDTTTAITVNGVLKASRVANSSLTCKGQLFTAATSTATIDWGKISDPIPSGVTASLILNYSAAMANFKYGLFIANLSQGYFCGATRNINAVSTNSISAGATSINVDDATGWKVGDTIVIAETSGTNNQYDRKTITSLTLISGTAYTVGFSATTYAHAAGCSVGNFSSNVTVSSFNTTNPTFVCFNNATNASNGTREVRYTSFNYVGSDSSATTTRAFVTSVITYLSNPFISFGDCSFYNSNQSTSLFLYQWYTSTTISNLAFFSDAGYSGQGFYLAQGTYVNISNCVFYYFQGAATTSGFSQGSQGCVISNSKFWGISTAAGQVSSGGPLTYNDCQFHVSPTSYTFAASGISYYNRCKFGSSDLPGTPAAAFFFNASTSLGQVFNVVATDCKFGTFSTSFTTNMANTNDQSVLSIVNKNADVTQQEIYTKAGFLQRDNAFFNRSTSSEKFKPSIANTAFSRTYQVSAPNNVARRVIGYLYYDANYTNTNPPSVTLSGLGITPQTYTAGSSTATWYKFDLSATQTSGADGYLTLTATGQSPNTTGFFWVDGLIDAPFVSACRHYGFLFDSNIYRTVNSVIQQTNEATVGAYTGISIASSTITLTSNHSVRELYDYCQWYLCQTANLTVADFFTSTDGVNFTSTYNIVLNGGSLTGSGTITTSGTVTITASETSTVTIAASNGTTGYLNITGLSAHAVYLQDGSGTQKDYQSSVTGTYSYFIPNTATGTWKYVIKKAGYTSQVGTFTASAGGAVSVANSTTQKLNPTGTAMYTGTTSALCNISFSGTSQANIQIGDGEVVMQAAFDMTETALATNNGCIWLASGKGDCSIFLSFGGNYLFMGTGWRIQRWHSGDVNATLDCFVTSQDGTVVDGTNGSVQFLTSAGAAQVWNYAVDGSYSAAQVMKLLGAVVAGNATGMGSAPRFKSLDGTLTRVTGVVSGENRTITAIDVS